MMSDSPRTRSAALEADGFLLLPGVVPVEVVSRWRDALTIDGVPGRRCLLDLDWVAEAARRIGASLVEGGLLNPGAVAIQAIAFDKTQQTNWKVPWHQDLMFPVAGPADSPGYTQPSLKDEIHFVRPPVEVLEKLVAARIHLDDCGAERGPLRVAPGTHRFRVMPSDSIPKVVGESGVTECVALAGDVLLMRPLLLHASSKAITAEHRRVLHLVYHEGPSPPVPWHRSVMVPTTLPSAV